MHFKLKQSKLTQLVNEFIKYCKASKPAYLCIMATICVSSVFVHRRQKFFRLEVTMLLKIFGHLFAQTVQLLLWCDVQKTCDKK